MNNIDKLNELLVDALIEDLQNEEKRTPGLYQAVARVIADNKERLQNLASAPKLESLENIVPFKLKKFG